MHKKTYIQDFLFCTETTTNLGDKGCIIETIKKNEKGTTIETIREHLGKDNKLITGKYQLFSPNGQIECEDEFFNNPNGKNIVSIRREFTKGFLKELVIADLSDTITRVYKEHYNKIGVIKSKSLVYYNQDGTLMQKRLCHRYKDNDFVSDKMFIYNNGVQTSLRTNTYINKNKYSTSLTPDENQFQSAMEISYTQVGKIKNRAISFKKHKLYPSFSKISQQFLNKTQNENS